MYVIHLECPFPILCHSCEHSTTFSAPQISHVWWLHPGPLAHVSCVWCLSPPASWIICESVHLPVNNQEHCTSHGDSCNELPQAWWRKTKEIYSLTVLGTGCPNSVSSPGNPRVSRVVFLWEAPGENLLPLPASGGCQLSLTCIHLTPTPASMDTPSSVCLLLFYIHPPPASFF